MDKEKLTIDQYRDIVIKNIRPSWQRVSIIHNVEKQMIQAITNYCYKYQLTDIEICFHLYENRLICAANWDDEPQGIDWWMDLSTEADMIENMGCINTFNGF